MSESVIVLFGGSSSERKVSVATAQNVLSVLVDAVPWFIDTKRAVHQSAREEVLAHERPFELDYSPKGALRGSSLEEALDTWPDRSTVFLLALHGGEGENGEIQRVLEGRGRLFTGSGEQASRDAFDKVIAKAKVQAMGLRVAEAQVIAPSSQSNVLAALRSFAKGNARFVAKPVADGSSVGLHLIDAARTSLEEISERIFKSRIPYLLETFLEGRELTVGVVDDPSGPAALPVSEAVVERDAAFDYNAKYLGRGSREITPAELPPEHSTEAQRYAVIAHRALGCRGYSRTDLILTATGMYFLEINTLPGLTKASFIPQQLAAAGRELSSFFNRQIELARTRER